MDIRKKKLLFVVNTASFFISHRLPIALEAIKLGYEVHLATGQYTQIDKIKSFGIIIHPLYLDRSSSGILSNLYSLYHIFRVFRSVRPDVVHLVTIKPVLLGGLAARLAAVPCVVAAISGLGFVFTTSGFKASIRHWFVKWLYFFVLGHRNLKLIFQNDADREKLIALNASIQAKFCLIRGSGVDLKLYSPSPIPEGVPVVILAARLLVDKGIREFVQAAHSFKNGIRAVRFVLVGETDPGNPMTVTINEIDNWVSDGLIEWWGHHDDMPKVFSSSTIVVLPSYYGEGLPKVLIEAAACGRPVITTDHPGCRDAIKPNITGILVPVRNSAALVTAIERLLNDPSLCKEMGAAGRKLAKCSFDVNQVVDQHLRIYHELLQNVP